MKKAKSANFRKVSRCLILMTQKQTIKSCYQFWNEQVASLEKLERGMYGLFYVRLSHFRQVKNESLSNSKIKAIAIIKLGWNEGMNYFLDVSRWESVLSLCKDPYRKTTSACHFKPFFLTWSFTEAICTCACPSCNLWNSNISKRLAQVYLTLLHLMELKLIAVVLETFLLSWWQNFGLSPIILQISLCFYLVPRYFLTVVRFLHGVQLLQALEL